MAVNEQQIIEIFKTLSTRFINVHHPAVTNFWNGVLQDVNTLTSDLVGADVQVVEHLVQQDLAPIVNRAIQAMGETGPKLGAHASQLEAAFRGLQL